MVIPKWYVFIKLMNTCPERQQTVLEGFTNLNLCFSASEAGPPHAPLFLLIKPSSVVLRFNH